MFEKSNLITIAKVIGIVILVVIGFVVLRKLVAFINNPFSISKEKSQRAKVNNDYVSSAFNPSNLAFEIDEVTQSYNPFCITSSSKEGKDVFLLITGLQTDEIRKLHNYWIDNYESKGRKPLSRAISSSWCGSFGDNKNKAISALNDAGVNV